MIHNDKLVIGGHEFNSRFILGSGKYSMKLIEAAIKDAGAEIITLAVRRANTKEHENILDYIPKGITLLPNTSGARNAEEAVRIARLARELGCPVHGNENLFGLHALAALHQNELARVGHLSLHTGEHLLVLVACQWRD